MEETLDRIRQGAPFRRDPTDHGSSTGSDHRFDEPHD